MKICPRCDEKHEKSGVFCSRSCANRGRVWSEETNIKRRQSLIERKIKHSAESVAKRVANFKKNRLQNYINTPFELLGKSNKRRRVFEDQNGRCNRCGLVEWQGQPIPLELEHKNGINSDNRRENLEGLCPNCHALTSTWRGRNNRSI